MASKSKVQRLAHDISGTSGRAETRTISCASFPKASKKPIAGIIHQLTLRVQVPKNQVLGFGMIVILVSALGKYMIIGYLDPKG